MKKLLLASALAILPMTAYAVDHNAKEKSDSGDRNAPTPAWRELRKGVLAYTGDDGGDATTLTVCDSAQAYIKWVDDVAGASARCTHRSSGVPVTIASNDVVATDQDGMYIVFIRADHSSWSGWTSYTGIRPHIPVNTKLTVYDSVLAPARDSTFGTGKELAKGTVVRLISQDAEGDLYVGVEDHSGNIGSKGWINSLEVESLGFAPGASTSVSYQFDCDALAPHSHFYEVGNYTKALKEIEPLAKPGCPEAMHLLGVMYGNGQGVKKDLAHAYALLLVAYSEGMVPNGGKELVPVLGDDPNEPEISQLRAKLTPDQATQGEALALRLAGRDSAKVAREIKRLGPAVIR